MSGRSTGDGFSLKLCLASSDVARIKDAVGARNLTVAEKGKTRRRRLTYKAGQQRSPKL